MRPWSERKQFRYYTRLVKLHPADSHYHQKRLWLSAKLSQSEMVQGALADYFFGCWYELAQSGKAMLDEARAHLPAHRVQLFERYMGTGQYLPPISVLATRFSVLVLPSMNVASHHLYINKEDALALSKKVGEQLLQSTNAEEKKHLQDEYLRHCLACHDRMGFMQTWFLLAKGGFEFDRAWLECKTLLEG